MKYLFKRVINNMNIKTKLLITYLTVVVLTVLIVGIYLTNRMTEIVIDKAINEAKLNANKIQYRTDEILKIAINTSNMIYQDSELHSLVIKKYDNYGEIVEAYLDYSTIRNYLKYYKEIDNIRLYVENDSLLSNSEIIKANNNIKANEWYIKAKNNTGVIFWNYKYDDLGREYNLALIRGIRNSAGEFIGILVINMNNNELKASIKDEPYGSSILLDGKVVASNDEEFKVDTVITDKLNINLDNINVDKEKEFDDGLNHFIFNSFDADRSINNKFQVMINIPIDSITNQTDIVIRKSIVTIGISIIISLIVILYFSKNFSDRINLLSKEMHRVVEGDFNIKKSIKGNDEIAKLYDDLYTMMESIKKLINEVYIEKIQKEKLMIKQKEAEFKMLASQINPHFLYNTLETIRMRAFCNGDRELADIVKKLGKIMRRNLEVCNEDVSLESELELIKNYLEIQGLRFKGKVEYEFNVDVDTKSYKVLPLLLQPFVENAFVHGLEASKDKGKITINIFEDTKCLVVEVMDNGIGISKEKLEFINKKLGQTSGNGKKSIGMTNVDERIKIFYGNDYGINILSELGVGTKVTILLPVFQGGLE